MTTPDADPVIARAATAARLLTARGAGMRLISIVSNLALIVLVTPTELGLLAVVRGIAGLAGDASDLGFAWALLRRKEAPSREEYRTLAGIQLALVLAILGVAIVAPSLLSATAAGWRGGLLVVLLALLTVPLGTGARIRIERAMDFRKIAFVDLSSVALQNLALLGFALAGRFPLGVFVATGGMILYANLSLWAASPGPAPGFQLTAWRKLGSEFAGFTLGHVGSLLNTSGTPILIATLFGLPVAGLWSFAMRLGNVLQLAFEGFRRAAVPAAGLVADSGQALARLAQQSFDGAARFTLPMIAACFAALPVVGQLLPQWAAAVPIAQLYVIGFGIAGIVGAAIMPVAVARHGYRAVLAEQFAPVSQEIFVAAPAT